MCSRRKDQYEDDDKILMTDLIDNHWDIVSNALGDHDNLINGLEFTDLELCELPYELEEE